MTPTNIDGAVEPLDDPALLGLRKRLHSVLDHAGEAIVITDGAGVVEQFSRAAEQMFGYGHDEVVGRNVRMLISESTRAKEDGYLGRFDSGTDAGTLGIGGEVMGQRKDGSLFRVDVEVNEFFVGDVPWYTGVLRDLSEGRMIQEQLLQSQRVEGIGQLAGGIAHDFNNLLTVINGFASMVLVDLRPDDPHRSDLEAIYLAGSRAAELTAQLLAFGRRAILEPRIVDINEVIRETEQMLQRTLGEDIAIVSALSAGLPPVEVDPGQFSQVIMNLAINARDAMPLGGKLSFETEVFVVPPAGLSEAADLAPGSFVRISVSDNGEGMPPAVRDHIFEPFYTTKPVGKGTGLGLSVVHGIVKQSGGSIHVYTEAGRGTTFTIYLPALREEPAGAPASPDEPVRKPRGVETVLLAEDAEGVRAIIRLILERQGYRVLLAVNGVEALEILKNEPSVALIITDVVMPEMGGRELGEAARMLRPDIPLLYISGYPDDASIRQGILEAEVQFLRKPFTPDGLLGKVAAALRK